MTSNKKNWSRRHFIHTAVAGGALMGARFTPGLAAVPVARQQRLSGTRFTLDIDERDVNLTGRIRPATVVNGSLPGPLLRWREGERVQLNVTNRLQSDSSIHWHGMILPPGMDGVPGISFPGIGPGDTFNYEFDVQQSGTYWYHSHSGFQEQTGVYGPIIIDPAVPEPFDYDRDYVVMLSDWSDENPHRIFAKLKKMSHYYNPHRRTALDLLEQIGEQGLTATFRDRAMWNRMRMSDRDISDVTGYTYTFLVNGQPPSANWTGLYSPGERIRLRFINAAAMTLFDVRIPDVKMTVVAADGQLIQPVDIDEFRIGVAETYDVIVEPGDGAHTIFAQAIDRSGFARATLATDGSQQAPVPAMDPPPVLSHADMGMSMNMNMDHSGDEMHAGHNMGGAGAVSHPASESGPQTGMAVANPADRTADPGVGLRDRQWRVLTYADLKNFFPTADGRMPGREIEMHLTGNMERFMWSIDGIPYEDAEPVRLRYGERARITLINDAMMNHPMHLHGMWSELETGDQAYLPRKHTMIVQPGAKLSFRVTADAPGGWAFHCHLLYHMAGMFREVIVA